MTDRVDDLLICECTSTEHQLIFSYWPDKEDVFISAHLSPYPFWGRLIKGVRYIFGYKCAYGHFEGVQISRERLRTLIEKL